MAESVLSAPHFQHEGAAFDYVEARLWPRGPVCPFCGECEKIGRLQGKTTRPGLRKCYACRKPFTVRIGSIFEGSHFPLHLWLQVIHLMCASKKGISSRQIQRMYECSMKTAWFLTHRIREAMNDDGAAPVGGEGSAVEVDETYFGPTTYSVTKQGKLRPDRGMAGKRKIVTLVERNGRAISAHVDRVTADNIEEVLNRHVRPESRLMTDEAKYYRKPGKAFASHERVNHKRGEYVRGDVHTNTVEGFFSIFKRGLVGVYQHVSERHLPRYLNEFDFRYSNRIKLGVDDVQRTSRTVAGAKGKRLTYETTRAAQAPFAQD